MGLVDGVPPGEGAPRIAIVGMGGVFPGCRDLRAFWNLIEAGDNTRSDLSDEWRIDPKTVLTDASTGPEPDRAIHSFGFGLGGTVDTPASVDPLAQLTLAAGDEAYRSCRLEHIPRERISICLGNIVLPTERSSENTWKKVRAESDFLTSRFAGSRPEEPSGSISSESQNSTDPAAIPAAVLAAHLGIHGEAYTLDAACASSLYTFKFGAEALRQNRADAVLVGGVSRPDSLYTQIGFSQLSALSKSGRSSPLSTKADGLMVGQGAGIFVLKRLEDAVKDDDSILGIVAGVGISTDTQGGLMAPHSEGQVRAMRKAYDQCGWSPDDIDLVECHATGTPLGDSTEIKSLQEVWGIASANTTSSRCILGSVKSNIGHLLTAAGASSVAKVLLAMQARTLPPTAGFKRREGIPLPEAFEVLESAREWKPRGQNTPRRAGINGFGFGGINAHLLIEEWAPDYHPASPQLQTSQGSMALQAPKIAVIASKRVEEIPDAIGPGRYRIPPIELHQMLPQQLLMLEAATEAIQAADIGGTHDPRTGVFIGVSQAEAANRYSCRWRIESEAESLLAGPSLQAQTEAKDQIGPALNASRTIGSLGGIVASRIAKEHRFGGCGFTVSANELSGVRALRLAADQIASGELDHAVVGAVDTNAERLEATAYVLKDFHSALDDGDTIVATFAPSALDDIARDLQRRAETLESRGSLCNDLDDAIATASVEADIPTQNDSAPTNASFSTQEPNPLLQAYLATQEAEARAHKAFLSLSEEFASSAQRLLMGQFEAIRTCEDPNFSSPTFAVTRHLSVKPARGPSGPGAMAEGGSGPSPFDSEPKLPFEGEVSSGRITNEAEPAVYNGYKPAVYNGYKPAVYNGYNDDIRPAPFNAAPAFLDYEDCLEFARGRAGNVLGKDFADLDEQSVRTRLPDGPLLLCHRVMSLEGEPGSLGSGRIVTEHDIFDNAWYLDAGHIPTCIAVEAGQADLLLSAFLGADHHSQGERVYRLLDAEVIFHQSLASAGKMIRYDIRISEFFKQGETLLFRFGFEATVDGQPLLSMRNGCAGFFTARELDEGRGLVFTGLDKTPIPGKTTGGFDWPIPIEPASYSDSQLDSLRRGDYAACFGKSFGKSFGDRIAHIDLENPGTIPGDMMRLVHRIKKLEPRGGKYGLGVIIGEADIRPDNWFLTCHFVDDMVMPGTLMYECCLHTLRVFLMRMGWVGEASKMRFEPMIDETSRLKCRGQVLATTKRVTYEIIIKELGYRPGAYAKVDAIMYADDKPIVEITNMTAEAAGLVKDDIDLLWQNSSAQNSSAASVHVHDASDKTVHSALYDHPETAVFDKESIWQYCEGKPSLAFGEPYKIFDDGPRRLARLPRDPFCFLDAITSVDSEQWAMQAGGTVVGRYDVPVDAWYFAAENTETMPFSILLEIALQPCGWFSAYMGSALQVDSDVSYRNLGGTATQFLPIDPSIGTLKTEVHCKKVSQSAGMIIQEFDFTVTSRAGVVYRGETTFGFFSKEALAQQVGIRGAALPEPRDTPAESAPYPVGSLFPKIPILMIDTVDFIDGNGGAHGLGLARATKKVDHEEWFFQAHFYQDPVMPGSLGIEAFAQLLKAVAFQKFAEHGAEVHGFQTPACHSTHNWQYRGQVIPSNSTVQVDLEVTGFDLDNRTITARGWLSVDGLVIYGLEDFTIGVKTEKQPPKNR